MAHSRVIIFTLNQQYHAISIANVYKIVYYYDLSSLPGLDDLCGVFIYNSETIPIINYSVGLELPQQEPDDFSKVILINYEDVKLALVVDDVEELSDNTEHLINLDYNHHQFNDSDNNIYEFKHVLY